MPASTRKKRTNTTQRRKPLRSGGVVGLRAESAEALLSQWEDGEKHNDRLATEYGDRRDDDPYHCGKADGYRECIASLRRQMLEASTYAGREYVAAYRRTLAKVKGRGKK